MNKDFIIDEIISIEELEDGDTIDITVEDTHMFYANDIYTHNSGFNSEYIETGQMGGSIKRAQKTHFLMSAAKTDEQKEAGLANIKINKARFAQDGQRFEDAIFDNDAMIISINRENFSRGRYDKAVPKVDENDIKSFNNKLNTITGNSETKYVNYDSEISNEDEMAVKSKFDDVKSNEFSQEDKKSVTQMLNRLSEMQNIKKSEK